MQLQLQELVETLVRQHEADFALLHADLRAAVPEVATRWADRFPSAADQNGQNRCTAVRQTLVSMFSERGETPFPALGAGAGPGLSVVLTDGSGTKIRVRRWPTDHLKRRIRPVLVPPPGQSEALAQAVDEARQQALDEGLEEPVLPRPVVGRFDLYVLWWASPDEAELQGAQLAAVAGIDSGSLVRILAVAPLPPPRPAAQHETPPADRPLGDFDEGGQDEAEGTGGPEPA